MSTFGLAKDNTVSSTDVKSMLFSVFISVVGLSISCFELFFTVSVRAVFVLQIQQNPTNNK